MSVAALYVCHGIAIGSPSAFVSQITSSRITPGINWAKGFPSGLPGPLFIYNINQLPETSFGTTQIKTLLDAAGTGVLSLGGGNTDYFLKATEHLGSRIADATTSHIRLRANKAFFIPRTLSASDGQPASMDCRIINTYDGSTAPIVAAGGVALSGTPTHAENFTVGPASLNTVAINGIESINIDFGISTIERRGDGDLYLSWACEQEHAPVVTIRTVSAPWAAYGINGTALTALSLFFRKCDQTGRVANATVEHINITATAGAFAIEETGSGSPNDPVVTTITIHPAMPDATTRALSVDTTAAIS